MDCAAVTQPPTSSPFWEDAACHALTDLSKMRPLTPPISLFCPSHMRDGGPAAGLSGSGDWWNPKSDAHPSCAARERLCPRLQTKGYPDDLVGTRWNFLDGRRIFDGLKAYLRATDHTSSNIISRDRHLIWKHQLSPPLQLTFRDCMIVQPAVSSSRHSPRNVSHTAPPFASLHDTSWSLPSAQHRFVASSMLQSRRTRRGSAPASLPRYSPRTCHTLCRTPPPMLSLWTL
jgi:hypothetical protein